jgi:hypothetical protein
MLASPCIVNNLFHLFQKFDPFENFSFRGFFNFPRQHVGKVTIQQFHKQMNRFQKRQFVIQNIDGNGEEQARISPVNEFLGIVFNEVV